MEELRRRALDLVSDELDRLRGLGPAGVRPLAGDAVDSERGDLTLSTHVSDEDGRLLVLVEAWRGRRTLATGGFAMAPDGTTSTPQ